MKILEITVKFRVNTNEEETQILSLLALKGRSDDRTKDSGVKAEGPVAYTPSSPRTIAAAEALSKCKRVGVLRLEVLETWANAYPHVDLAGEILKAEAWAESKNVSRTPRGWQKALNTWLCKAQDFTKGQTRIEVVPQKIVLPITPEAETKAWIEAAV